MDLDVVVVAAAKGAVVVDAGGWWWRDTGGDLGRPLIGGVHDPIDVISSHAQMGTKRWIVTAVEKNVRVGLLPDNG